MPCSARGVSAGYSSRRSSSPCTRTTGGDPAVRCRSEPSMLQQRAQQLRDRDLDVVFLHGHAHRHFTTLATSSMDVRPMRTFSRPSSRSVIMPCSIATVLDRFGRRALDREPLDLLGHRHDLVQPDPAAVAGVRARRAARRPVELRRSPATATRGSPAAMQLGLLGLVGLLAALAQLAREPLGHDAVDRRGHEERLDVHLGEPRDRARARRSCAATTARGDR